MTATLPTALTEYDVTKILLYVYCKANTDKEGLTDKEKIVVSLLRTKKIWGRVAETAYHDPLYLNIFLSLKEIADQFCRLTFSV